MISRRITFSALFILILVASLFAGLTSCSDVLLQKESTDFALSFVAPGASSGRAADGAAHWNVTAWLELEDGTRLQSQQTAAMAGKPVAIAFAPVAAGTRLKVKVELLSAQPPLQKYAGESEFMEVLPGEKTVRLELKLVDAELEEPSIVNADTPTITIQPVGETRTFAAGQATAVKKELTVKASVSDGGTLTYQWYSNTSNSTTDGTRIEGATSSSYEATVNAKETKYFYCIVTNTNNNVTAAIITSVVAVASVEGELASIAAEYTGSQGYMLVGQINHNDFTVTETYTSGTERVDVTVTPNENSYSIDATNGDSAEAIGKVPYTVTRIGTNVTTTAVVPVKYELDVNNLTITGGDTVEQNGNLVLTAEYKTVDGADVEYKLYDESGSSNTYKVIEKVTISWVGATQKDNVWEADAETGTDGQKTATVKLSTRDEWCVTTDGIEKSHQYTVDALVNADTPTITAQPEGETKTFAAGKATAVEKELTVKASVSDDGTLTYQWYSNTSNSTTGGTRIEGATSSSYEATVNAKETKYFYCIVTNTNNNVSGNKTAAVTSNVAILASIEGSLEGITARYNGTNLLVGASSTDFIVTENYSGGNSVEISSIDGLYTVEVPENSIGNVPVTIKSTKDDSIQIQVPVPIKYELDVNNLTITGDTTVTQNGNLKLTAEYKVNGNDSYNLYTSPDSSGSYKIIENVSISWTGATPEANAWKATAETNNTGSKTATVKLSTRDEWCVTTDGIEKSHQYTVNALVNAATPDITEQPVGETKLANGSTSSWTKKLNVTARSTDGGVLSYQWYSNNTNSTTGGTRIEGATNASYTPGTLNRGDIRYFYCEVTNTNTQVNGATATSITTNVVVLAFVEGTLTSITATYHGSQGKSYMLVDSFSFDDFSVTEAYTANGQSITKKVTSLDGQYTFSGQSDDSGVLYVGNVPLTITNSSNPTIQAQVTVPIKYELDVSNLTITGDTTVEQNGNLKLTAEYKADGNDVQYKLYDESSSSNTYKVTEKVSISWTGDVQQSSAWEAFADTATAGQKTATVKLISTDEWCVATEGIQANHQYTVNALVNAATPDITEQPVGETKLADDSTLSWTKKLNVTARSTDGGVLSYQWYSNNTNSTEGGSPIEGATNASYTPGGLNRGDIRYFYCEVTNTNTQVNGATATSITTNVVVLAFVEGTLTSITATHHGSQGYMLVGQINHNDFTVTETYTANGQSITKEVTSIDGLYTVEVPENSIGNVPVTIKSVKNDSIQTQVTVPIKYELDVNNLTITGGDTVEQNGDLKLTAEYKVNGNDSYNLYTSPDSSSSYKIIEYVRISWTGVGATLNGNEWEVNADTKTVGSQTATVMLSTRDDEWCITTNSIEKSHQYTVNAATSGGSGPSNQAELVQAIADAPEGGTITINNTIVITDTLVIDKYIIIEGSGDISLLRDNTGTITGPMIEVQKNVTLKLSSITLDGQWNNSYTNGENNPLIYVNTGTLELNGVTLKNNHMVYWGKYTDKNGQSVDLYAAAAIYALDSRLTIQDSTFTDFSANDGQGGVINIEGTSRVNSVRITISNSTVEACGGYNSRALQMGSSDDAFGKYFYYDINKKSSGLSRQIASITPTSP